MGALLYLRNTVKCVFLHINLAQPYLTHMCYQLRLSGMYASSAAMGWFCMIYTLTAFLQKVMP